MASPGKITLVHYNTPKLGTRYPHGYEGWYILPEMLHQHCLTSDISNIYMERVSYKNNFFNYVTNLPMISSLEAATNAAVELTSDLLYLHPNP